MSDAGLSEKIMILFICRKPNIMGTRLSFFAILMKHTQSILAVPLEFLHYQELNLFFPFKQTALNSLVLKIWFLIYQ